MNSKRKIKRLLLSIFKNEESEQSRENDFITGADRAAVPDRPLWNLRTVIDCSMRAWREDPLARRIVSLTTQYVIGRGVSFTCSDADTDSFLHDFWNHPLNRMDNRIREWSDEICRTGNLFVLFSSDAAGMTYVRAVPAVRVQKIISQPNDIEQPLAFEVDQYTGQPDSFCPVRTTYPAEDPHVPSLDDCICHFTVNRPVGGQWGEPDLAPILRWLDRYSEWLEGRVMLNKYRSSFIYVVKSRGENEAERLSRQRLFNMMPPKSGSILVSDEREEWTVLKPDLESGEANEDGNALKRMIAAGAGIPLHFLGEPETDSKAQPESADGSTYRNYEQRQQVLLWMLKDVLSAAAARRALVDSKIKPDAEIYLQGDDISSADNLDLSEAGRNAAETMQMLVSLGAAGKDEAARIVYRFLGEQQET